MLPLLRGVDRLMEFPSVGLGLTATSTLDLHFRMCRSDSSAVASACMIPFFDHVATLKNPAAVPTGRTADIGAQEKLSDPDAVNVYGSTSDDCGVRSSAAYFQVRRHA